MIKDELIIEELYDFAGVKLGCKTKEFVDAINKKVFEFKPKTEEEKDFLLKVQTSLLIYGDLIRRNKKNIRKAQLEQQIKKDKKEINELIIDQKNKEKELDKLCKKKKRTNEQEYYKQLAEEELIKYQIEEESYDEYLNEEEQENGISDDYTKDTLKVFEKKNDECKFDCEEIKLDQDDLSRDDIRYYHEGLAEVEEENKKKKVNNLKLNKNLLNDNSKKYRLMFAGVGAAAIIAITGFFINESKNEDTEIPPVEVADYIDDEVIKVEETYTIQEGDTIYSIAEDSNVKIKDIKYADENKKLIPETIYPGEEIILTHKVKGELLEDCVVPVEYKPNVVNFKGFAEMFNTTEETIFKLNDGAVTISIEDGSYTVLTDKLFVPNFNDIIKKENKSKSK